MNMDRAPDREIDTVRAPEREMSTARAPFALTFRPAESRDAREAAALVFASGEQEFRFLFGAPDDACIAFLRACFAQRHGRFSWRRHRVAVAADGVVLAVLAAHGNGTTLRDDAHFVLMILRRFGPLKSVGVARRGLILETELPAPRRDQVLVAHCATRPDARATGVFTRLFGHASDATPPFLPAGHARVLDVLESNHDARRLYRRLGFIEMPRRRPRSAKLPAELKSIRMHQPR